MTCGGCSGAIDRVLKKNIQSRKPTVSSSLSYSCPLDGVEGYGHGRTLTPLANSYQVSLPTQQVLVWGPSLPTFDEVTEKIAKTGKKIVDKKVIEKEDEIPVIVA